MRMDGLVELMEVIRLLAMMEKVALTDDVNVVEGAEGKVGGLGQLPP